MEDRTIKHIVNARVVLENEIIPNGVIAIEDGRIAAVSGEAGICAGGEDVLDAGGLYVGPGFVDIHVHGGNGSFFYEEPKRTAEYFLSHGETTVLAALYYDLCFEDFKAAVLRIKDAVAGTDNLAGIYMEGPYMNPKYGASPEKNAWRGQIKPEEYTRIADLAGDLAKVWVIAPEREGIEPFVRYVKEVNPDAVISVGHSEAAPAKIYAMKKFGLTLQTHCMNATGRVSEWEGVRGAGPDEACLLDDDIYAEVICDSRAVHVNKDMLGLIKKVKGVDRIVLITDSFVGDSDGDLILDDMGRLCGSGLTMERACANMAKNASCTMCEVFKMAALNPARVTGMDGEIGSIAPGKRANLVLTDDGYRVHGVILNGRRVY